MIGFKFPFFRFPGKIPFMKNDLIATPPAFVNNVNDNKKVFDKVSASTSNVIDSEDAEDAYFFDVFGVRLYYDDLLLISLIFFLYNEGVDDTGLFIALILLLLS